MQNSLSILILAAGRSSRMGSPKALLPWAESTVIQTVVETAKQIPNKSIIVVSGAQHDALKQTLGSTGVELLYNPNWPDGMGSSLAKGIETIQNLECRSALVLLADMPTISTAHLNNLIQVFNSIDCEAVCSDYGKMKGVPAIFDKNTFKSLSELSGDFGAKRLLNNPDWKITSVKSDTPFEDLDTPEAYQQLKKKYGY